MQRLTKKQEQVLELWNPYGHDMSLKAISNMLGIHYRSIRRRMKNFRKHNPKLYHKLLTQKQINVKTKKNILKPIRANVSFMNNYAIKKF